MSAYPSLAMPRVLALLGGFGLVCAFFMPWFSSQGLLLSGQFLHTFLGNPGDLRRYLPAASGNPTEAQALRALVDLFPVCGALAMVTALVSRQIVANIILALSGLVPLVGWVAGITRLPPGANPEVGLALIAVSALAILVGLALDLVLLRRRAD